MRCTIGLLIALPMIACAPSPVVEEPVVRAAPMHVPAIRRGEVSFEELAPGVWMHSAYKEIKPWGPVVTNGLVIVRGDHSLLIDTAWNDSQTQDILDWAAEDLGAPVKTAVFTHAHSDKMGGVGVVAAAGARTMAHSLSNKLAPARGLVPAEENLPLDDIGAAVMVEGVEIYYPGGGHTHDNITAYDEDSRILFGGCLIRPAGTQSLGNTADADLAYWSRAAANLEARYPDATIVVPSHGEPAGYSLLGMTRELARSKD